MRIGVTAIGCGLALLVAAPASADHLECATDDDCPSGLSCHVATQEECVAWADETGQVHEECTTETVRACGPRTCDADADCPPGLACLEFFPLCDDFDGEGEADCASEPVRACGIHTCTTSADCSGPASCRSCEELHDADVCAELDEPALCVPPFLAPCERDDDCGPGFRCEPAPDCGYGDPRGEEGEGPDCGASFPGTCEPIAQPCTVDGDCAEGLVCERFVAEQCDWEEETGGVGDPDDGEEAGDGCAREEIALCLPPNAFAWFAVDFGDAVRIGSEAGGEQYGPGQDDGGGGSSGCSAAGAGVSLLGLLGAALLLRAGSPPSPGSRRASGGAALLHRRR